MKRFGLALGVLGASCGAVLAVAACIGDAPPVAQVDGGPSVDATPPSMPPPADGGVDAAGLSDGGMITPPRPLAPLSTARTTSRKPTLKWALPSGVDGAYLEICKDRACATVEETIAWRGASAAPTSDLTPGVHFWRMRAIQGNLLGTTYSPVWEVVIPKTSVAGVDTSWGSFPDPNGDGFADILVTSYLTQSIDAYFGGPAGPGSVEHHTFGNVYADGGLDPDSGTIFGTDSLYSVTTGDLDGDGYVDIIGGYSCIFSDYDCGKNDGRVLIRRGGPTAWRADGPPDVILHSPDDGRPPPNDAGYSSPRWGIRNCSVGDVDGDGYGDLVITAYGWDGTTKGDVAGAAFLYRGSATATTTAHAIEQIGVGPGGNYRYGTCAPAGDVNGDGFADFVLTSEQGENDLWLGGATLTKVKLDVPNGITNYFQAGFARAASAPGDLDGDGLADVVLGGYGMAQSGANEPYGRVYVYRGAKTTAELQSIDQELAGSRSLMGYGLNLSPCGDLNGDGIDDLVVASGGDPSMGQGWIYFVAGKSGLLTANGGGVEMTKPNDIDAGPGQFGASLGVVGDVDGDGFADLAVSFVQHTPSGDIATAIYVFRGGATSPRSDSIYRLMDPQLGAPGFPYDWLGGPGIAPSGP